MIYNTSDELKSFDEILTAIEQYKNSCVTFEENKTAGLINLLELIQFKKQSFINYVDGLLVHSVWAREEYTGIMQEIEIFSNNPEGLWAKGFTVVSISTIE